VKFIPRLVAISLIFLCAGCVGASSESSAPSYEDSVSQACQEVLLGLDLQGLDPTTTTRDFHFRKAATQFRNLSNQNQAFTDYAEVLNAWKTDAAGKINEVYSFCGIDPTPGF
jgi:uncharacterized membrane protein